MSGQKCSQAGCNAVKHIGKDLCLDHFKQTPGYTYGLDADLKAKMSAKLDPQKMAQAQAWMETLSGIRAGSQELHEYLKDGKVLCAALNKIKPGSIASINSSSMPFKQMENIAAYLAVCKSWGMKSSDLFMTTDLYENANMVIVVDNIHALGSLSRKQTGFNGPYIGVKLADETRRDFTPAQLNTGGVVSRQNVGSYGYQDETHNPSLGRQIIKNVSGHTAASVPSKQTQGSYGYQVAPDKSLDKIIKAPVNTPATSKNAPQVASVAAPAPAPAPAAGGSKFCSGCGTARGEGAAKFCSQCGGAF